MKDKLMDPNHGGFEAVPAVVVADQTDKLGKRLMILALSLLVVFFVASSYIQSAKNGRELNRAAKDRSNLASSLDRVTEALDQQFDLSAQLRMAILQQNVLLSGQGRAPVPVPSLDIVDSIETLPGVTPEPRPTEGPSIFNPPSTPRPVPTTSNPRPRPTPTTVSPTPRPSNTPRVPVPRATPLVPVGSSVCALIGVCVQN